MNRWHIYICILLIVCTTNCSAQSNFTQLVSNVPITPLPIGWANMEAIDSIKCSQGWNERSALYEIDRYFELDTINKYSLNNIYSIKDLGIEQDLSSVLAEPKDLIFSKRLPDMDGRTVFLYQLKMQKEKHSFPCWIIVVTDNYGKPIRTNIVAMSKLGENDNVSLSFCYIDQDYNVHNYFYNDYAEDIVNEDGDIVDVIVRDESYIYRVSKSHYSLRSTSAVTNRTANIDLNHSTLDKQNCPVLK